MPLLRLLAAALAVCLLALTSSASAAPKCKPDQAVWKTRSGTICGKSGARAASTGRLDAVAVRTWARTLALPSKGRKAPKRLRRAVPRLAALAAELVERPRARAAAVVDRQTVSNSEYRAGVKLEARAEFTRHDDNSTGIDLELKATGRNGNSIRIRPDVTLSPDAKVACPTADGTVSAASTLTFGGTYILAERGRVIDAKTGRATVRITSRGRVGRDARLEHVDADVAVTAEIYKRGFQQRWSVSSGVATGREGDARLTTAPSADFRIRVVGATAKEERDYEQAAAKLLAKEPGIAEALQTIGPHARKPLLDAEPTWYDLPNECARTAFDPATTTLAPGDTTQFTGLVLATNGGGEAAGTFTVESVSLGSVTAVRTDSDPGSPALFSATAGEPNEWHFTAGAQMIATSRAGRAQGTWDAKYEEPEFPERFTGTVSATTDAASNRHVWNGTGTWTRSSVTTGPDGSRTAWYDLTSATVGAAESHIGQGCHWAATASGGTIEAGDVELRILPDGRRVYAFMYDVALPVTYKSTGCPPGGELPPLDGAIPATLDSRPAGSPFRPADERWRLRGTDATDVAQPPFGTTVGSWELTPG